MSVKYVELGNDQFLLSASGPDAGRVILDQTDDTIEDYMEALLRELIMLVESHPDAVRPDLVKNSAKLFVAASEVGLGLDEPSSLFEPLSGWKTEAAAEAFTSFAPFAVGGVDKRFAVEVADCLTYEGGQSFYRFATTVTKLID